MNTVLMKQDPVMVANHKDEPPDHEDFILHDALPLFDNRLGQSIDTNTLTVHVLDRVVPDTDFEAGYWIPGNPVFKKPDLDIRPVDIWW